MSLLILTTSDDATANYLCSRIVETAGKFSRINTDQFATFGGVVASSEMMTLTDESRSVEASSIKSVWYRRPRPIAVSSSVDAAEQRFMSLEWGAALEGWLAHIPMDCWLSHPSKIMGASFKLEQLRRAPRFGLCVPNWVCTVDRETAVAFMRSVQGEVIGKPLYSGFLQRSSPAEDSHIYTSVVSLQELEEGPINLGCPTLLQERIYGHDVRVTVVDRELVAVRLLRTDGAVDVRRNNMDGVRYNRIDLPAKLAEQLISLTESYGLRFAAIDILETKNGWVFLELNPNGQWAWLDLVAGTSIYCLFLKALGTGR